MFRIGQFLPRPARLLGLAIVALQLGGAAAIADASRAHPGAPDGPAIVEARGDVEEATAALPVAVPVPETAAPKPTTTTTAAPPPPPAAPRQQPAAAPAPAPAPVPAPAPPPPPAPAPAPAPAPPSDPMARVQDAYARSVPAAWRSAIPVRFELIEGNTSWAAHDGTIRIGSAHYAGSDSLLRATIAHEFGHLVAFRYGSQAFNGAAPEGWPAYSGRPEEAWADCVSRAFTGVNDPSHGLPPCDGSSLSWTQGWLGAGPGAHPRTA